MNTTTLSGTALENVLAAKPEELLRSVDQLRRWQLEHVGGKPDSGIEPPPIDVPGDSDSVNRRSTS
jgi:hypothetical protein